MLSSLLSHFRQRYPQGSLTSELLTIHDGLYVVRVCAGVNGITLASGFGANTTLEAAEDVATTRALERLSVSIAPSTSLMPSYDRQPDGDDASEPVPSAVLPKPALLNRKTDTPATEGPSLTVVPSQPEPPADLPLPLAQSEPADVLKAPAPDFPAAALSSPPLPQAASLPNEPLPQKPLADDFDELADETPALGFPPAALARPPLPKEALPPQEPLPQKPLADDFDEPADEFMDLGTGPAVSVDLSDIIAQTDVELQRLGWGVNQGREFLEKTYGKRSRHDLTDDELLEFLLYLETQPTPGSP